MLRQLKLVCSANALCSKGSLFTKSVTKSSSLQLSSYSDIKDVDEKDSQTDTENTHLKELLESASVRSDLLIDSPIDEWSTLPYPEGVLTGRDQSRYSFRPKADPRETSIILFPGQGSQYVGMARELVKYPVARDLFEAANEILEYDLLKLCLHGPKEKLDKTVHCQPAIFVCSLAAVEKLKEERPAAIDNCIAATGFSLGEITALTFAGAINFERAVRLIKVRAEAMQLASEITPSGMALILYNPAAKIGTACVDAKNWCLERGIEEPECAVANYLYPECKVIAGNEEALKYISSHMDVYGIKKMKRLPVSGAFHTKLMMPAVEPFKKALMKAQIETPLVNVHSNVDGKRYRDVRHIRNQLPKQIYSPVKWEQILHILYERDPKEYFPRTFECGPGESLKALLKKVNGKAWNSCISVLETK